MTSVQIIQSINGLTCIPLCSSHWPRTRTRSGNPACRRGSPRSWAHRRSWCGQRSCTRIHQCVSLIQPENYWVIQLIENASQNLTYLSVDEFFLDGIVQDDLWGPDLGEGQSHGLDALVVWRVPRVAVRKINEITISSLIIDGWFISTHRSLQRW